MATTASALEVRNLRVARGGLADAHLGAREILRRVRRRVIQDQSDRDERIGRAPREAEAFL